MSACGKGARDQKRKRRKRRRTALEQDLGGAGRRRRVWSERAGEVVGNASRWSRQPRLLLCTVRTACNSGPELCESGQGQGYELFSANGRCSSGSPRARKLRTAAGPPAMMSLFLRADHAGQASRPGWPGWPGSCPLRRGRSANVPSSHGDASFYHVTLALWCGYMGALRPRSVRPSPPKRVFGDACSKPVAGITLLLDSTVPPALDTSWVRHIIRGWTADVYDPETMRAMVL